MKRFVLALGASFVLAALVPASALAQHRGHHRRHHARFHHVHVRNFGKSSGSSTSTSPTAPTPAGTIQSFDPTTGMLTIALTNGTTVSGLVTPDTRIIVVPPPASQSSSSSTGSSTTSGGSCGGWQGHWSRGGFDQNQPQLGSTSNLTAGATVLAAELRLSSAGAQWEKVVLMGTSSTSTTSPTTSSSTRSF